jgi:hypothetical protein
MAPKRLLLLAASVVAALDANAPPSLVSDCTWLRFNAGEDDFVALKFDVDNDFSLGPTMEWGFLADLLRRPEALALVDELFVELHFYAPSLRWVHLTHSMKQAFDVLRQLRACGLPVHAWP